MSLEVFLDETPGETRGVILRAGRPERLLSHRDDDVAAHRLGARLVGRIVAVEPSLKGAFVDLGVGEPFGFLHGRGGGAVGEAVQVEVAAEPRGDKGPALKRLGAGEGGPRLLEDGPDVRRWLERLAPGVEPETGSAAIQAGWEAVEAALASGAISTGGLDVAVERTRALVAVDLDLAPAQGVAGGKGAKDRANRLGLAEAARLIRLKSWGGLVAIDLVGSGHDGAAVGAWAKTAFGADPEIAAETSYGPVSRFGLVQLTLPWRRTPVEEVLDSRVETRAREIVRRLRFALLTDTAAPRVAARAAPEEARAAQAWVARLGPRAHLIADPALGPGACVIEDPRP